MGVESGSGLSSREGWDVRALVGRRDVVASVVVGAVRELLADQ